MAPPSTTTGPLPAGLQASLLRLRRRRRFDVERCIAAKVAILNSYLRRSGVSGCVVGVSGGVDSALTLALLRRAADQPGSPIRRLVAVLAPIFAPRGATNQQIALERGREVAAAFSAERAEVDLTASQRAVKSAVDGGMGLVGDPWSSGQLVSTIRTPALYYVTSLLTQEGDLAVLCGTTNRDEGSYLGFFGKASDGMVDLQVISDLHKSEVYAAAERLGVPESVRRAVPTGDTYDGRVDESMIGAPYDFVELYTGLLALEEEHPGYRRSQEAGWDSTSREAFARWAGAVEQLHRHNHHKYISGASAIHLDVYERHVPGGWTRPPEITPPRGDFVGEFELPPQLPADLDRRAEDPPKARRGETLGDFGESLVEVEALLGEDEVERLRQLILDQALVPVGQHGVAQEHAPAVAPPGSGRATAYSPALARALWRRLGPALPPLRIFDEHAPDERGGHPVWRPVGLSPLLRGIVYGPGGSLVPHYDSSFDYGDGERRTLMSVLVGLGPGPAPDPAPGPAPDPAPGPSSEALGSTQWIRDGQRHLPPSARDYADRSTLAPPRDVLVARPPRPGSALVFDHRILHQGAPTSGEQPRVLLRADVLFRRCGPPLPAERPATQLHLEALLDLPPAASSAEVDRAYARHRRPAEGIEGDAAELAWRILRDPYYASAYRRLSALDPDTDVGTLRRAGFLDDRSTPEDHRRLAPLDDPAWMVTPLHHVLRRLRALRRAERSGARPLARPVVLVTTGSFCPIHRGHVEMMELAKAAVEGEGMAVLGGYISVSHDAYVLPKCGPATPSAAQRLAMCEAALADHEWLMVDPWEALYRDRAVNFTDVIAHLEAYLSAHLRTHRPVEVVYVFGSDNADFSLTFAGRGRCVCVPRPGDEAELEPLRRHPAIRGVPRILLGRAPSEALASTTVRGGDEAGLAPAVQALWRQATAPTPPNPTPLHLVVRDEGPWALRPWLSKRAPAPLLRARERHLRAICELLEECFAAAGQALSLDLRPMAEQTRVAAAIAQRGRVLSLDPCTPGDLNLEVSRSFELAADLARPELVARPGSPPLDVQLAALPEDDRPTILLDDDRASGRTLAQVQALLGDRLAIAEVRLLCPTDAEARAPCGEDAPPRRELCDARDLLPGSRAGGLVVNLPDGALARAPYLLPYVRPSARIQLPLACERLFSRRVWELSADFFATIEAPLRVLDADPAFRRLAHYIGFGDDDPLEALCRWHAERLSDATP